MYPLFTEFNIWFLWFGSVWFGLVFFFVSSFVVWVAGEQLRAAGV